MAERLFMFSDIIHVTGSLYAADQLSVMTVEPELKLSLIRVINGKQFQPITTAIYMLSPAYIQLHPTADIPECHTPPPPENVRR